MKKFTQNSALFFKVFTKKFFEHDIIGRSAQVSWFFLLSFFPIINKYRFAELVDKNINIIFANSVDNLDQKILSEHKIHIFRIIREITQNTIKHSKSPVLSIRIVEQMKKIVIETIDQGVGFDANDNLFRKKGHGINNIINRVELMNGSIFLDARLQKGVHFTIEIPI